MKYLFYLVLCGALVLNSSCGGGSRSKMVENINLMEKNGDEYNAQHIDSLTHLYEKFVNDFPKDTLASKYLFNAANYNSAQAGNGDAKYLEIAIQEYQKVISNYADSKEAATSLFRLGYIYDNDKGDTAKAREYYMKYLEKYPIGEYANDVRIINSKYLGKTPEEIFESMQKEGKIDTSIHVNATVK